MDPKPADTNPAPQATPSPTTPTPQETPSITTSGSSMPKRSMALPIAIVMLVIGVGFGYLLSNMLGGNKGTTNAPAVAQKSADLTLPPDAVRIQACSDHRGSLYVKPADIPVGPVYMVNNGKVIGVEFMLAKDEFLNGKSFKYLSGLGVKVDHVNIGLLSQGHEGYPIPHYHVDMYSVPKSVEDGITCSSSATPASGSASLQTPSASESSKAATAH